MLFSQNSIISSNSAKFPFAVSKNLLYSAPLDRSILKEFIDRDMDPMDFEFENFKVPDPVRFEVEEIELDRFLSDPEMSLEGRVEITSEESTCRE